ncbi:MAG: hypothetical protein AAFN27_06735 [Pseudomonadota bacterium]
MLRFVLLLLSLSIVACTSEPLPPSKVRGMVTGGNPAVETYSWCSGFYAARAEYFRTGASNYRSNKQLKIAKAFRKAADNSASEETPETLARLGDVSSMIETATEEYRVLLPKAEYDRPTRGSLNQDLTWCSHMASAGIFPEKEFPSSG